MLDKITTIRLSETPRTVRVSEITVSGKDIFESAVCRERITNLLNSDLKSIRGKKNQIEYFNKLQSEYNFDLFLPTVLHREKLITKLFEDISIKFLNFILK
jgi:hypothetical protein